MARAGGIGLIPLGESGCSMPLLASIEGEDPLHVPGHRHEAPLAPDLVEAAEQKLSEAENRLDDAEHRLRDVFALSVELLAVRRRPAMQHGFERRRGLWRWRC